MLLAHRRRALLTFGLAGMQLAWFVPFALLLLPSAARLPIFSTYAALFAIALLWLLLLDALNRWRVRSPQYELAVVALVIASTLLFLRLLLFNGRPAADLAWLGSLARTLFSLAPGAGQVFAIIVLNVILWQRAAAATSEEPSFFTVGLSFRGGMLLLILGAGLAEAVAHVNAVPLVWCFFACGLLAVALARIEEKAAGANSQGTPLPRSRLTQVGLAIGVTVGLAFLAAQLYTRAGLIMAVRWLGPLRRVLDIVVNALLVVFGWVMTPVMNLLEILLRRLLESGVIGALRDALGRLNIGNQPPLAPENNAPAFSLPPWLWPVLRNGLVVLVLLLLLGFVLLYLERVRRDRLREHGELESGEEVTLGGGIVDSALGRLRSLANLVRRYGLNRQLLAAVSVQNIYANVSRLARLRGHARLPAQPPDGYLPALCLAFPGHDAALARITAAYMRVHYGDRAITPEELTALRADYHRVRRANHEKHEGQLE